MATTRQLDGKRFRKASYPPKLAANLNLVGRVSRGVVDVCINVNVNCLPHVSPVLVLNLVTICGLWS